MRLLLIIALAAPCYGQNSAYTPQLISYPASPTGTCVIYQQALNTSNGNVYACNMNGNATTGSWVAVGGLTNVSVAPSGNCTNGVMPQQVISTGQIYTCQGGTWGQVISSGTIATPVVSPNPFPFNVDLQHKGPNPYLDIRAFGAAALNTSTTPYTTGITATPISGNTSMNISTASTFVNGMGVDVWNSGATNTLTTPVAPVVTSVLAAGPPGSGYVVSGAAGGSETTCYVFSVRDKGQGLTLASPETCVTGQARGHQTTNITSCVRSANTLVTCTTSAHTLAVGAWVKLNFSANSDNSEYGGYHKLTVVADNTHFAYQWGRDSRAGASTVASGTGTVEYWQANHVIPESQSPQAGAWQYVFYRGATSAETYVDVSMIVTPGVNLDSSYMVWDDFGTTYTTASNRPQFIPNTPPSSATNDTLVTTISSGAGTTTLILANAPSQTPGAGTTIVADNTPAYTAAFTAAATTKGAVYVPAISSNSFATNSILDISSFSSTGLSIACAAYFGDTLVTNGNTISGTPACLSTTSFSIEGLTNVTFNAKPGIYTKNFSFTGLALNPLGTNTNAMFVAAGGIPTGICDHMAFLGASGGGDFASIPLIMFAQGQAGSAAAGISCSNIFTKGTAQGTTPLIMSKNYSELTFNGVMMAGRGVAILNCSTCTVVSVSFNQQFENQGPVMPLFVTLGAVNLTALGIIEDTGSQPIVSHLGSGLLTLNINASTPSSSIPQITGTSIIGIVSTSGLSDKQQGVNTNYTGFLTGSMIDGFYGSGGNAANEALSLQNVHLAMGPGYSNFTAATQPAAPTCVTNTAGPPFSPAQTNQGFAYTVVYPNGGNGLLSPRSNLCSADGSTQQIVVTIPAAIAGASGYNIYGNSLVGCGTPSTTALSFTATAAYCGNQPPNTMGGGPSGMVNNGLWSQQMQFSSTLFANLGTPANGTMVYCSDCNIANPCTGSGTGAIAKRLAGTWICN